MHENRIENLVNCFRLLRVLQRYGHHDALDRGANREEYDEIHDRFVADVFNSDRSLVRAEMQAEEDAEQDARQDAGRVAGVGEAGREAGRWVRACVEQRATEMMAEHEARRRGHRGGVPAAPFQKTMSKACKSAWS